MIGNFPGFRSKAMLTVFVNKVTQSRDVSRKQFYIESYGINMAVFKHK